MNKLFQFYYLGNLHVVLATGICAAAFFKLPDGNAPIDAVSFAQILLVCWSVYIFDRILDVIKLDEEPQTLRHKYHWKHQYNLQVLGIAAAGIAGALLLFQKKEIIYYGAFLLGLTYIYLKIIVPKYPQLKDYFMPIIYTLAVVGVPFVLSSSINLSSWILGFMFLLIVFQNIFSLSFLEENNPKKRKQVMAISSFNLFIYIFFFWGNFDYVNKLALIFVVISLLNSLLTVNSERFKNSYRFLLDTFLFLPLFVF